MAARPIVSAATGVAAGRRLHHLGLPGGVPQHPPVSTSLLIPSWPVWRGPPEPHPFRGRWLICRKGSAPFGEGIRAKPMLYICIAAAEVMVPLVWWEALGMAWRGQLLIGTPLTAPHRSAHVSR